MVCVDRDNAMLMLCHRMCISFCQLINYLMMFEETVGDRLIGMLVV